ncbi:MAG: hypothetical protein MJZ28_11975 [Paludibacteraceae bacterium]|nr:hypothetical protein [Paludibacteraceae bacterium]
MSRFKFNTIALFTTDNQKMVDFYCNIFAFVRMPYILAIAILCIDGILAVCSMPHNSFAWVILALAVGLVFTNVTSVRGLA